jgi:hypothetical protein
MDGLGPRLVLVELSERRTPEAVVQGVTFRVEGSHYDLKIRETIVRKWV